MGVTSACSATWSHLLFCNRYASEAFYGQSSPRSPVKLRLSFIEPKEFLMPSKAVCILICIVNMDAWKVID